MQVGIIKKLILCISLRQIVDQLDFDCVTRINNN